MKLAHARMWGAAVLFAVSSLSLPNAFADTLYVDLSNPAPEPPYTNWLTAATNIQDAVDAANASDIILVSNGVYATGATVVYGVSNRVVVNKAISVQSVNGPDATVIQGSLTPGTTNGSSSVRCVILPTNT